MAEALDPRELDAALGDDVPKFPIDDRPRTIDDLPKELLVSVFEAVEDQTWVRRTVPLVCKEWAELYRTRDASPLHETLEVDFRKEVEVAWRATQRRGRRFPVVHASRVVSWAERRAGSVRKLYLVGGYPETFEEFSSEDLGTLVAIVGPSLTELDADCGLDELDQEPFWKSLRASVAPAGLLRSLVVRGFLADVPESEVEPLGQLAGSLEELVLTVSKSGDGPASQLSCFPESFCDLTELRRLELSSHSRITAIPAKISSLKKLEVIELRGGGLSSLPKELGELSGLTKLDLVGNKNLGNAPQDEAFPAELRKLKSLRHLDLSVCGLRAVPAFAGELESLERLGLYMNRNLGNAPQHEAFPTELGKMKSLRHLDLSVCGLRAVPAFVGELESLRHLDLSDNENLGNAPQDEAFPAELGKMKSLRALVLASGGLRTVPAFVGELKSLEILDLSYNNRQIYATLDILIKDYHRLREVRLRTGLLSPPQTLAHSKAFEAKLLAKNPNAQVDN